MIDPYYNRSEVSNSDLSALKIELSGKEFTPPTEAYHLGNMVDYMITEPDRVDKNDPVYEEAKKLADAFFTNPLCMRIVTGASFQKVSVGRRKLKWKNSLEFELNCRCKWDFFGRISGDIKTTTATTQKGFEAACKYFDYDRQRAWYMDLENTNRDVLIGISKVNREIFFKTIKRGDEWHQSGVEKYTELAFKYWLLKD